jgi:hypothetical protein
LHQRRALRRPRRPGSLFRELPLKRGIIIDDDQSLCELLEEQRHGMDVDAGYRLDPSAASKSDVDPIDFVQKPAQQAPAGSKRCRPGRVAPQ